MAEAPLSGWRQPRVLHWNADEALPADSRRRDLYRGTADRNRFGTADGAARSPAMTSREVNTLASRDGFANAEEFWKFFGETHGRILRGQLIEWRP